MRCKNIKNKMKKNIMKNENHWDENKYYKEWGDEKDIIKNEEMKKYKE